MPYLSSHLLLQANSIVQISIAYVLVYSPLSLLASTQLELLGSSMHVPPASFVPVAPLPPLSALSSSSSLKEPDSPPLPQSTREVLALLALTISLAAVAQSVFATSLSRDLPSGPASASASASTVTTTATATATATAASPTGAKAGMGAKTEQDGGQSTAGLGEKVHTLHDAQARWMTLAGLRVLITGVLVGWIYVAHSRRNVFSSSAATAVGVDVGATPGLSLLANRITFAFGFSDMLFWGYLWTVLREETGELAKFVEVKRRQREEAESQW